MSTMRFDNIDDGITQISTTALRRGAIKAWVSLNGSGVVAVLNGYNTASITDNGVGSYTHNFSTAMTTSNIAAVCTWNRQPDAVSAAASPTTSSVLLRTSNGAGGFEDGTFVNALVIE